MPAKKKPRRARLFVIAVVLLLVAGVGYGAFWSVDTVRASFPQTTGSIQLDGLSAPVAVKRDDHGIPQLYADTAEDLFRAQGYVHAQDRFWEMDVRRHLTAGRLSEMFGESQIETDAFLRTLGWRKVAQEEYDTKLSKTTRKYLQAYAAGVNAYLADHSGAELSLEYAALGIVGDYAPQKWTPVDSVAWLKAMAWDLRGNMQDEIDRALLSSRLTEEQIQALYPEYPYDRNEPIVRKGAVDASGETYDPEAEATESGGTGLSKGDESPDGTDGTASTDGTAPQDGTGEGVQQAAEGVQTQLAALSDVLDAVPAPLGTNGDGIGSNSWVVSGDHTTTGKPLLANDPHLAPQLPSLWYQMGLHCRTVGEACPFDVAGFTFSGMPGVVIGHNQAISWGFTNLGADVTDLYLEKIEDGTYVYDGKNVPYATREEVIKVAGGKDRKITVRSTRHGPIVSDRSTELGTVGDHAPVGEVAPDRGKGYAVALRWTALEPSNTMDAVFSLNAATDFEQFRRAARDFAVPSQNLIYADTKGNIGYQAPGRIPVRGEKHDGRYPAPGWDPAYEWDGYIPQDALPWEYNPERGYIVTANQAVVDAEKYPYLLTEDWGYGARSQRINDLIRAKTKDGGKISTKDMASMQLDNSSEIAKILVPHLLKIDVEDPYVREAQKLLEDWDYSQDADSAPAAYFNGVWRNLLKLSFGNKLPKEVRVEGECLRVRPADDSGPIEDLDGTVRTVRECGTRSPQSAQPDGGDRWFEVVRTLLEEPESGWWTPGSRFEAGTGDRDALLARAMKDARWELTTKLGKDVETWSWGRLHRLMLKNQTLGTAGPGVVQHLLNRGPWDLGGGEATVNATGWNAAGGYEVVWVPSMRMVVNMADLDKSRWINLASASGHAYHSHYTDQTDKWAEGHMLTWRFSEEAVDGATEDTMALTP